MCVSIKNYIKNPSNFDKQRWQTFLTFLALIAAIYLGYQQNNISKELFNINFRPSLHLAYDGIAKNLELQNMGKTPVFFSGYQIQNMEPHIEPEDEFTPYSKKLIPLALTQESLEKTQDGTHPTLSTMFFKDYYYKKFLFFSYLEVEVQDHKVKDIRVVSSSIQYKDW